MQNRKAINPRYPAYTVKLQNKISVAFFNLILFNSDITQSYLRGRMVKDFLQKRDVFKLLVVMVPKGFPQCMCAYSFIKPGTFTCIFYYMISSETIQTVMKNTLEKRLLRTFSVHILLQHRPEL